MKGSLTEAVAKLGLVNADPGTDTLQQHSRQLTEKCDANTAQVLQMVLALKGDITSVRYKWRVMCLLACMCVAKCDDRLQLNT